FARDAELSRIYEQDIAGGKWPHMMSQTRIGYTYWQQPETNVMPALQGVQPAAQAALGVVVEGDRRAWPGAEAAPLLRTLDPFAARTRQLVVFNRGSGALESTAATD